MHDSPETVLSKERAQIRNEHVKEFACTASIVWRREGKTKERLAIYIGGGSTRLSFKQNDWLGLKDKASNSIPTFPFGIQPPALHLFVVVFENFHSKVCYEAQLLHLTGMDYVLILYIQIILLIPQAQF